MMKGPSKFSPILSSFWRSRKIKKTFPNLSGTANSSITMVASKKKRTLSSEDKLKMTLLYELLQWKGLDATAAALADEADLSVPSNQPTQSRSREEVWSRLSMLPQIKSETSSDAEEGSDSDSDSQSDTNSDPSESDSSDDSDSADSEEVNPPKKVVLPRDGPSDSSRI